MADAEYIADAADAALDIAADGNTGTLYSANPATANAWDPAYNPETGTAITFLEIEREEGREDGQFYEFVKLMVAQSPASLVIQTGDQIDIDGVRFSFRKVKPFRIGGVPVFWDGEVRRG